MLDNDLPLDDLNPAGIDAQTEAGGMLPPGKYHAKLEGAKSHIAKSGSTGTELIFTVVAGPFAGSEVKDVLWDSDNPQAKNREVRFAHRLGRLVVNSKGKYERVKGKTDWCDCLGADVIIETMQEAYVKKDGNKGTACKLTFGGIWSLDEKAVKDVPKAKPGEKAVKKKPDVDASTL